MFRRYLHLVAFAFGVALLSVALFNLAIDPYSYFGTVRIEGLNSVKPRTEGDLRDIKRNLWSSRAYDALILGNSRAEVGFDPGNHALTQGGYSTFNMALPGTDLRDALSSLAFVNAQRPPRLLIVGLEFLDFLTDSNAALGQSRPLPSDGRFDRLGSTLRSLFTVRATTDSLRTLVSQHDPFASILPPNGFNSLHEYKLLARNEGYWALFEQRAGENAAIYVRKPKSVKLFDKRLGPAFADLTELLRIAPDETHLVIYPYHAQLLFLFAEAGLWPAFEEWKRTLVQVIAHTTSDSTPRKEVFLWDFSGAFEFSAEAIPLPNDRSTETRWYWEGGHFKSALGDVALQQLFGSTGPGVRLDSLNIEIHIEDLNRRLNSVGAADPALVREAVTKVRDARRKLAGKAGAK